MEKLRQARSNTMATAARVLIVGAGIAGIASGLMPVPLRNLALRLTGTALSIGETIVRCSRNPDQLDIESARKDS